MQGSAGARRRLWFAAARAMTCTQSESELGGSKTCNIFNVLHDVHSKAVFFGGHVKVFDHVLDMLSEFADCAQAVLSHICLYRHAKFSMTEVETFQTLRFGERCAALTSSPEVMGECALVTGVEMHNQRDLVDPWTIQ